MESEERPNKLRKLDHDSDQNTGHSVAVASPEQASSHSANGIVDTAETLEDKTLPSEQTNSDPLAAEKSLSKNQLKKLLRRQQWEGDREGRKARRKEKLVAKKARKKEALAQIKDGSEPKSPLVEEDNKTGSSGDAVEMQKKQQQQPPQSELKRQQNVHHTQLPLTIIVDCSFDELMTEKERTSLASQLTRCYSDNRSAAYRAHLIVSSFGGGLKERFETVLANHHRGWKAVKFVEDDFASAAREAQEHMRTVEFSGTKARGALREPGDGKKEGEIIYLTSDSPDTLTELSAYSTYIVGGLVDRNRHKGICYQRAMDRGIKTAKLPIGDYLRMESRFVLTTNHVVEIMLHWLEMGDWAQAFLKVIPKRKGGILKKTTTIEEKENGDGGGSVDAQPAADESKDESVFNDDGENGISVEAQEPPVEAAAG